MRQAELQAKGWCGVKIVCLMPTYGRCQSLLNNSLACFFAQDHPDKHLFILDDLGTLEHCSAVSPYDQDVWILSTRSRAASVGAKYNEMIATLEASGIDYDAVAVWDDDDVYLPSHLSNHAATLATHSWSKPSQIVSAYFDPPKLESAHGRFHGSIAVTRETVKRVPWIDTTRATFDQEYIAALAAHDAPGDTLEQGPSQYVYRWQTTQAGHCSGLMGRPTWYADYQPDSREPIDRLWPEFDADTQRIVSVMAK